MPIDPPTDADRRRLAADLRQRAALVREHGWDAYAETWSSGEVLGVRLLLGDVSAVGDTLAAWAPTLWGVGAAEADASSGYAWTRSWFAALAAGTALESAADLVAERSRRYSLDEVRARYGDDLEMTEAEKASLAASNAAIGDLAGALLAGDREGGDAAFAAVQQTSAQVDRDALLNKFHMPRDAEGFEDGLRAIMMRIPDGWGRWISCSRGWYPIIIQLDRDLAEIDPDYELHQVKEKFAGLRYYFHPSEGVSEADQQRMDALVDEAEEKCERTCELCGEPGVRHVSPRGWLMTLCPGCAAEKGYARLGELVTDLTPAHRGLWRVTCYGDAPDSHWDMSHGEVSVIDGEQYRDVEVLALPSVLRTWRIRLSDGTELESGLVAAIERVR
ncbi:hypothetical protein BKG79_22480 [Mycobacteroides chelonae]|uniref:hypothetical protein n=1 Tax=Mycobacteroides chelonae TaxID=1774 RepID=UPI0008A838A7|nr:hypothetical protein [Mycobacteroides chelonae]OHU33370.1 hypothetical protein BKG79_22480 [Mycobacteroides chelonae]